MAHQAQIDFCTKVKNMFADKFKDADVLDIGSMDINGNNRYLFENSKYLGIDLGEGRNVDLVCKGHEFKRDTPFSLIISTECFEHDRYFKETIENMIALTTTGGLILFTCAGHDRNIHGTDEHNPGESPFTNDYFCPLNTEEVKSLVDFDKHFSTYEFEYTGTDLYFFGVRK